jgi:hypothetical protein
MMAIVTFGSEDVILGMELDKEEEVHAVEIT